MFAVVDLSGVTLARFDFGFSEYEERDPESQLRWVLADLDVRREGLWEVGAELGGVVLMKILYQARAEGTMDLLQPIVSAFGTYGRAAKYARHEVHPLLTASQDPALLETAIGAVGSFGMHDSRPYLLSHLGGPHHRTVVIALCKVCDEDQFDELARAAQGDTELEALVQLGAARRKAFTVGDADAFVRRSLESEHFTNELCGVVDLYEEPLAVVLRDETLPERWRARAATVLRRGRAKGNAAKKAARSVVFGPEPNPRLVLDCIAILGYAKSRRAVPQLCMLLDQTSDPRVQHACIDALGRIGDPRAVGPLLEHYNDREGELRDLIEQAMYRLSEPIRDERYELWLAEAEIFKPQAVYFFDHKLTPHFDVVACAGQLASENPGARAQAFFLFGVLGSAEHAELLRERVRDEPDRLARQLGERALQIVADRR